ncbi:MAG: LptE family protein [Desulfocapsaceae bacterium]|nr:LptE family protein [Desulfocapsaceae bacterium]
MKTSLRLSSLFLLTALLLTACGYHNPYIYTGPEKSIYVTHWKNKTNALQLDTKIYQSLTHWFQKSNSIKVTNGKAGADLILAGEVLSIQLPSLSYGIGNTASSVKVILTVRYILKDIKTGEVLLEVPGEIWSEDSRTTQSATATTDNEDRALATIIDNLSEKIYIKALDRLSALKG